tara:strand:+ start:323 stop:703 length:381 start_codon:yes stop_codon:yes gene_type:complete
MRITLNLAQATAVLDTLELMPGRVIDNDLPGLELPIGSKDPLDPGYGQSIALKEATLILKMAVQQEVQNNSSRLENLTDLIKDLDPQLYDNVREELTKVTDAVNLHNTKAKDKYFDEDGKVKPKRL